MQHHFCYFSLAKAHQIPYRSCVWVMAMQFPEVGGLHFMYLICKYMNNIQNKICNHLAFSLSSFGLDSLDSLFVLIIYNRRG